VATGEDRTSRAPGTCPKADPCRVSGAEAGTDAYDRSEADSLGSGVALPSIARSAASTVESCTPG
jgi:hypothetical protein